MSDNHKTMRKSGVLLHISSLPGEYSIGSLGNSAFICCDFLSECGFSYWQILPIGICDEYNSPYKSYSAFAGNPYFIDLEILYKNNLISHQTLENQRQKTPYTCEYDTLFRHRFAALYEAAQNFQNRDAVDKFINNHPEIDAACRFLSLKHSNDQKIFCSWNNFNHDENILYTHRFIQYEFFRQWRMLKEYANTRGIGVIGDMPIYIAHDSAEVFEEPHIFQLDENKYPKRVAGVAPDYFSPKGQVWGNPLYNYDEMKKDGYSFWKRRISFFSNLFDGLRIDHFKGLSGYFSIPAEDKDALRGKTCKAPGMELVKVIKDAAGKMFLIAEDLGSFDSSAEELLNESGLPGMRVIQFGFMNADDSTHRPHHYAKNTVAYTGTHDNNTLLGFLFELDYENRQRFFNYCGYNGSDISEGIDSIIQTLMSSRSDLVILPIQDILKFGSDTRMNRPGKAEGNWLYRVTEEQLSSIDKRKFYELNKRYSRV